MKWLLSIVLGTVMISTGIAQIQESPKPRMPVGPAQSNSMLPPANEAIPRSISVPRDRVRVQNVGNQTLTISYWDPEGSWRTLSVRSAISSDLVCEKCGTTITIAFNNGKTNKVVQARSGNTYILGWSRQLGVWDMTLAE
jgi:hypothetical protein